VLNILDESVALSQDQMTLLRGRMEDILFLVQDLTMDFNPEYDFSELTPQNDPVVHYNFVDDVTQDVAFHRLKNKIKAISLKKLNSLTDDICSICHENHEMRQVATMSCCKNHLGHDCFHRWALLSQRITCPCCRTESPGFTTYRQYAARRPIN
jgi:hypothetical protein